MLKLFFFSKNFKFFCQNGFYIDFIFKKYFKFFIVYVNNIFINIFLEKYIIEYFSKNIFNKLSIFFLFLLNLDNWNFKLFIKLIYLFLLIFIFLFVEYTI